jgi:FixJ family two-component response regulator
MGSLTYFLAGAIAPMEQPVVYILDDDPDMRDSLLWLMKTVGLRARTFASAAEFLRDFTPHAPGCVILDVRMPGTSGLDLFEELVARGEGMPVIFITAYADVPMAVRAMKSGAVEFVEKPFNRQTLLDKVQRAIKDDVERRGRIAAREKVAERFRRLTGKEREVLELIKEGRPNKEIASRLQITPRAVELRRSSLMRKLGVRSLIELLRLTVVHEAVPEAARGPG